MRPVLILAGALLLAAAPALTQTPEPAPAPAPSSPPPSDYMHGDRGSPVTNDRFTVPDAASLQCFNGRFVVGSNRVGDRLYVQAKIGGIFRLDLKKACDALDGAEKLAVRGGGGGQMVCAGGWATIVVQTAAGPKQCAVSEVRRLSRTEIARLATPPTR